MNLLVKSRTTWVVSFIIALALTFSLLVGIQTTKAFSQDAIDLLELLITLGLVPAENAEQARALVVEESITIGNTVEVNADGLLNVRSSANGSLAGQQSSGARGIVVGGPVNSGSYTWWHIDFSSGTDGWVAGEFLRVDDAAPPILPPPPPSNPISVALHPSTPGYGVTADGTTGNTVSVFTVAAGSEPVQLTHFGLKLGANDRFVSPTDVTGVTIWDGATLVGRALFVAGRYETVAQIGNCSGCSNLIIPENGSKTLAVKVDTAFQGLIQIGVPGNLVRVNYLQVPWEGHQHQTRGIGLETGGVVSVPISTPSTDTPGLRVYAAYPVVELIGSNVLSQDSGLFAGRIDLLKFKVTAIGGQLGIHKLSFLVSTTSATSRSGMVTNMNVHAFNDSSFSSPVAGGAVDGAIMQNNVETDGAVNGIVEIYSNVNQPTVAIPDGQSRYFALRGDVSLAGTSYSVITQLLGDSNFVSDYQGINFGIGTSTYLSTVDFIDSTKENRFIWRLFSTTTLQSLAALDYTNGSGINGLVIAGGPIIQPPPPPPPPPHSLRITHPNGGEILENSGLKDSGIISNIHWTSTLPSGSRVDIDLMSQFGRFVKNIARSTPDDGLFSWPYDRSLPDGTYGLRIADAGRGDGAEDFTDGLFELRGNQPTQSGIQAGSRVRVTTPHGLIVRNSPSLTAGRIGLQPLGATGFATGTPVISGQHEMWRIDYDSGADGWSAGTFLELASVGNNTIINESSNAQLIVRNARVQLVRASINPAGRMSGLKRVDTAIRGLVDLEVFKYLALQVSGPGAEGDDGRIVSIISKKDPIWPNTTSFITADPNGFFGAFADTVKITVLGILEDDVTTYSGQLALASINGLEFVHGENVEGLPISGAQNVINQSLDIGRLIFVADKGTDTIIQNQSASDALVEKIFVQGNVPSIALSFNGVVTNYLCLNSDSGFSECRVFNKIGKGLSMSIPSSVAVSSLYVNATSDLYGYQMEVFDSSSNPPTDLCLNIEGIQTEVPNGLTRDENGNCVVASSGSLSISLDSSSPAHGITADNSVGNTVSVLRLSSTDEPIRLSQLGLLLSQNSDRNASPRDVREVTLWDGATLVGRAIFAGSQYEAAATIGNCSGCSDFIIPANTDKRLTVKFDASRQGINQPGIPGAHVMVDYYKFRVDTYGVGMNSGTVVRPSTPNMTGTESAGLRVYAAYPVIERVPLANTTLLAGRPDIFRFKVTAVGGQLGIHKFTFSSDRQSISLSNPNVYAYADNSFSSPIAGVGVDGAISRNTVISSGDMYQVYSDYQPTVVIPQGQTRYFAIRGDVTLSGTASSIATRLWGDGNFVSNYRGIPSNRGLTNSTTTYLSTVDFVDSTLDDSFIWRPFSTTTVQSLTALDYTNGSGLPGLPANFTDAQVLSGSGGVVSPPPPPAEEFFLINGRDESISVTTGSTASANWNYPNHDWCIGSGTSYRLQNGGNWGAEIGKFGNALLMPNTGSVTMHFDNVLDSGIAGIYCGNNDDSTNVIQKNINVNIESASGSGGGSEVINGVSIGTRVEIVNTSGLFVREEPSLSSRTLNVYASGIQGRVVGGPRTDGQRTWWYVEFDDGILGWAGSIYLEPNDGTVSGIPNLFQSASPSVLQLIQDFYNKYF